MSTPGINAVNVFSIDEEKLRYRIIVAVMATGVQDFLGSFNLNVPPPTSLTNSENYRQCRMKCDSFCAYTNAAVNASTWSDGAAVKEPAIELQLSCPTSQSVTNFINDGAAAGQGGVMRWRDLDKSYQDRLSIIPSPLSLLLRMDILG